MRKIDLTSYSVGDEHTFDVRQSLIAVLFNEDKLDGREVIRRDELARRIETWPETDLLLEETEWHKFVSGLKATDLKPHGRSIVEFVRRVLDAPIVDVEERK